MGAVPVIIAINIAVFLMWRFPPESLGGIQFMADNFLVSWTSLEATRYWTLITSAFSHTMIFHIFINMYALSGFGPVMEQSLGTLRFVRFYLVAAVISSFAHAFVSAFLIGNPDLPALGASGAVSGVIVLFALCYPQQKLLLFGLIPIGAIWGALLFVGLDIWGLTAQSQGGGLPIGHGAHLGGALTGAIYYFFFIRRRLRW